MHKYAYSHRLRAASRRIHIRIRRAWTQAPGTYIRTHAYMQTYIMWQKGRSQHPCTYVHTHAYIETFSHTLLSYIHMSTHMHTFSDTCRLFLICAHTLVESASSEMPLYRAALPCTHRRYGSLIISLCRRKCKVLPDFRGNVETFVHQRRIGLFIALQQQSVPSLMTLDAYPHIPWGFTGKEQGTPEPVHSLFLVAASAIYIYIYSVCV